MHWWPIGCYRKRPVTCKCFLVMRSTCNKYGVAHLYDICNVRFHQNKTKCCVVSLSWECTLGSSDSYPYYSERQTRPGLIAWLSQRQCIGLQVDRYAWNRSIQNEKKLNISSKIESGIKWSRVADDSRSLCDITVIITPHFDIFSRRRAIHHAFDH